MNTILSIAFLALAALVDGDKIPEYVVKGSCPNVDETSLWREQKPKHSLFGGVWYQHSLTPNPFQPLEECVSMQFDFDGEGFAWKGFGYKAGGEAKDTEGELYPMPLGDPHLMISAEKLFPAPLVILDTDYDNYACLYSCMDFSSDYYTDFAFVYSRRPTLNDSYLKKCQSAFNKIGLQNSRLHKTLQGSKCSY
ncbi:hypothetical protein SK128_008426 [Halocaridina rubra]|uniref:Lipocalin/cytosolic fatty-acid binding domain-containing protein n=1 Tax=Halocaridina rubra TaxID=373956 RepID=A0AAN8XUS9_HALRR